MIKIQVTIQNRDLQHLIGACAWYKESVWPASKNIREEIFKRECNYANLQSLRAYLAARYVASERKHGKAKVKLSINVNVIYTLHQWFSEIECPHDLQEIAVRELLEQAYRSLLNPHTKPTAPNV